MCRGEGCGLSQRSLPIPGEVLLQFIQNKEEQKKVLHACHVDPTAGHLGKSKTSYKIKECFMWHGVVKDSRVWYVVQSCICVFAIVTGMIVFPSDLNL